MTEQTTNTTAPAAQPAAPPVTAAAPAVDQAAIRTEAASAERKRVSEIMALATRHNRRDLGDKAVADGTPIEAFRGVMLDAIGDKPLDTPPSRIGLSDKEARSFSFLRAARAVDPTAQPSQRQEANFEIECSNEVAKRLGRSPRGIFIPLDAQAAQMPGAEERFVRAIRAMLGQRDLSVTGSDAAGGYLRGTDHLGSSFIDLLRNAMVIRALGARVLSNLQGNIAIPSQTGAGAAYWVAENVNITTESAQTFGQVALSPKTVGAYTDISRRLLIQSDPSVEMLIREDLAAVLAIAFDLAAINGSGSGNQPLGILGTSGIGSVAIGTNGGAPTWASVINLQREVAIDNALTGSLSYLTNPKVKAKLQTTARQSSGVEGNFILGETGQSLAGYPLAVTNQVPSNLTKGSASGVCSAMIFGNFTDVIMAEWGVLDMLADPYTGGLAGTLRLRVLLDADIAVRRAVSFAAVVDYTTT